MSFIGLSLFVNLSAQHCGQDDSGQKWCSKFEGGSVVINSNGEAECGKGDCVSNQYGKFWCSNTEGGNVSVEQSSGNISCFGSCEQPKQEYCVPACLSNIHKHKDLTIDHF